MSVLQLLVGFSKDVSRLRARHMSTLPRGGESHSVLITDIPCVDGVGRGAAAKATQLVDHVTGEIGQKHFKLEVTAWPSNFLLIIHRTCLRLVGGVHAAHSLTAGPPLPSYRVACCVSRLVL